MRTNVAAIEKYFYLSSTIKSSWRFVNCRREKKCESDFRDDASLENDYAARFKEKRK